MAQKRPVQHTFRLPLKYFLTRAWNHSSTLGYCLASSIQGTSASEAEARPGSVMGSCVGLAELGRLS